MKFLKYSLIAALALSGALCACDDDNDYAPGTTVSGDEVYFPITESASIDIPNEAVSVPVTVSRIKADNAISVNVTGSVVDSEGADASAVFTIPSQVSFAAGEKETSLDIAVDFAKVVSDEEYTISLKLEGDNITPYGPSERKYTLVYAPWTDWAYVPGEEGVYTMTQYTSGEFDVPVLTRKSLVNKNRVDYGVCDLFFSNKDEKDGPLINFTYSVDLSKTIDVEGVDCPIVSMSIFETGIENGTTGIKFVITDVRTWLTQLAGIGEDRVDAVMANNGWGPSYYNPETGTFNVCVVLTGDAIAAEGRLYGAGYEYLQLPGYKHYELAFEYTGNYVDAAAEVEYAIVNAYKSPDVTSYVYNIFPGVLEGTDLSAAIESLKADDELEAITAGSTNLSFPMEEDGEYTVVGVGLDGNGNEVCNAAYSFEFTTVQGAPKWESLGLCEYTDGVFPFLIGIPAFTFDVEIQKSTETDGIYRLVDPYKALAGALKVGYAKGKHYMTVDLRDPAKVNILDSYIGIDLGEGECAVMSQSYFLLASGKEVPDGVYGTFSNDKVTFPAGRLYLIQNESLYYANVDPENPTGPTNENPNAKFDPYYGKGPFCINMAPGSEEGTETASVKNLSLSKSFAPVIANVPSFKSSFKLSKSSTPKTSVSGDELREYRVANPRQIAF